MAPFIKERKIIKVKSGNQKHEIDFLATEEPLEIRLVFGPAANRQQQSISITMRTPGEDFELATGFLFTEGIIKNADEISTIKYCGGLNKNIVRVELKEYVFVNISKLERNFYTTSSCGICGKASIDAVRTVRHLNEEKIENLKFESETIISMPDKLREKQSVFNNTGGLHGCALFDTSATILISREDVGRHNAVDKLIGAALQNHLFPLNKYLLLLSGRASFELIQKAWMAGIQMVAAVGAPSSLAVEMAADVDMTLIGFLRNGNFNIYSGEERIIISKYENTNQR